MSETSKELRQLVRDVVQELAVEPPSLLDPNAVALRTDDPADFYFVGLIGGKDVGKSSMVNALVGQSIAGVSGFGEGTKSITAYAHRDVAVDLRARLEHDIPGQYAIVTHDQPTLRRQVLLDLPDIDSRYEAHLALTRKMLREMLYPLWVQSHEKYADVQAQAMLKEVAEANAADNFLFCLSKIDQLTEANAAELLRQDYAKRIARVLDLPAPPRVWVISAQKPDQFDMPQLRAMLSQQRSEQDVSRSLEQAARQQQRTLLSWVDRQDLSGHLSRLDRLIAAAADQLQDRIGGVLAEQVLKPLAEDPVQRAGLTCEVFDQRINRWPIVRLLNLILGPLVNLVESLVRGRRLGSLTASDRAETVEPLVRPLTPAIQATFVHLRHSQPEIMSAYGENRLWEQMNADAAVSDLRRRLAEAISAHQQSAVKHLTRTWFGSGLLRWLATLGAVLWFPFVQPILNIALVTQIKWVPIEIAKLVVQTLSGQKLLQDIAFLFLWFLLLWLWVRYRAYQRVKRYMKTDKLGRLDLSGIADQWCNDLLRPLTQQRDQLAALINRADAFRSSGELATVKAAKD